MSERWTYEQHKAGILKMMYDHRRQLLKQGIIMPYPVEDIAWAYSEGQYTERTGLHLVIHNIIYSILVEAAFEPQTELQRTGRARIRTEVESVLQETPIDELLADIPADEAREIRIDLEILGFIPPDITKPQW
jgi:hypothetical protein